MGVYRMDYLMYGWKFPYDMEFVDKFYERENCDDIHSRDVPYELVIDGMGGEYIVFGQLLQFAGEEDDGWEFVEIEHNNLNLVKPIDLIQNFMHYTGSDLNEMIEKHGVESLPKVMLFSNFS